jgi:hypothetical protein
MRKLFLILVLLIPGLVKSQDGLVRLELEAALNSDIYRVVPCDDLGLLVFFETKDVVGENSKNWYFMYYSLEIEPVWNANIEVVLGAEYKDYILEDSILYLFFLNIEKVRPGTENFEFIRIDLARGISSTVKGILPSETKFREMMLDGDHACIALDLKNDQAGVYYIDFKSGSVTSFNVLYPDQNFIEDIAMDTLNGHLLVLVSNYLDRRQNKMYLLALDRSGQFVYDMQIQTVLEGKYLNTGRICPLPDSSFMILGAYGSVASKIPSANEYFGVESSGVFATRIKRRQQEFMNYYNFMEFNNLRAGVNARDFYRLQKKKGRESAEYSLNYELMFHEEKILDSTLVMMMEAFYPEFRTVSDIAYDYWGRPVTQTYTVFDGFRIFNVIQAGFNTAGELVWDNSLEMNLAPTEDLLKRASSYFDGEPSLLFYNDGFRISFRVYLKNTQLLGFTKMALETPKNGDRISQAGYNTVTHWYDKYFMAYGYHTIQNNLLTDKNERTVFYINKLAFD